jgi:hypothetical protein
LNSFAKFARFGNTATSDGVQKMPLRTGGLCILALLAGCAVPPRPPAQTTRARPANPGLPGTILAVHPVPADSVQQVQTLLSGTGPSGDPVPQDLSEFIVRTGNGTIVAVVQPASADLRPGEQVRITTGGSPRISVPVIH